MITKSIIIDPDADTLIILPFIGETKGTDNVANDGTSSSIHEPLDDDQGVSDNEAPENITEWKGIHEFYVSMKHLSLASPRAKKVLQGQFQESIPKADGLRHWKFGPIFDAEAFKIVMNIMHAQLREIPDEVTLEMLANIAVIVDDLNCQNSVNFFAKLWVDKLNKSKLQWYVSDNLAHTIFVASVFELAEQFKVATYHAFIGPPDILSSSELPIAPQILDAIDQKRSTYLQNATEELQSLIKEMINDYKTGDCFLCRSAAMGALMMNIQTKKLSPEDLLDQSKNMSITTFRETVQSFIYPATATCKAYDRYDRYNYGPHVDLKGRVIDIIGGPGGLKLEGLDLCQC